MTAPVVHGTPVPSGWAARARADRAERTAAAVVPPSRPVVAARTPQADDPVPSAATRALAHLRRRGVPARLTYSRGPGPTARAACGHCGARLQVNDDGRTRKHGPKDSPCPGVGTTAGPATHDDAHAVALRSEHVVAVWVDGKYAAGWLQLDDAAEVAARADGIVLATHDGRVYVRASSAAVMAAVAGR